MRDMSLILVPWMASVVFALNLLPIAPRKRAVLMLPFVVGSVIPLFLEIPAPIGRNAGYVLTMLGCAALIAVALFSLRRDRMAQSD